MIFYTDGSTRPTNPGPGGFGVVILDNDNNLIDTYSKHCKYSTNNAEEMKAILYAVCYSILHNETAIIYSDSAYAINTFSKWMYNWHDNGWVKGDGNQPENLEIVKEFYELSKFYKVTFHKVKGHIGNRYNELADKLARGDN